MNRTSVIAAVMLLTAAATSAEAQVRLPVIFPLHGANAPRAAAPGAVPAMTQGGLVAAAGTDTVYFPASGAMLDGTATNTLTAEARWLVANPTVAVRLEGHGGPNDSRDYALAIGDRRANAVRDFLVSQGVAPERISILSWGKERPGHIIIGQSLVSAGPRVKTVVIPPAPVFPPPPIPR